MLRRTLLLLSLLFLGGCATATRLSITPEESHYDRTIPHRLERNEAFQRVELALAEAYNDLPRVLKLRQPEPGRLLLKPIVSYKAGGSMGADQYAQYTLAIVVSERSVSMNFELGPEISTGTWAPESEIPAIKSSFESVCDKVEAALSDP